MYERKTKQLPGFTVKYNINKLVYFEETSSIDTAIQREKQIKGWLRVKKLLLIEASNPPW
jgi:putative endonuclease